MGGEEYPEIPEACSILTSLMFCKQQAEAYRRCAADASSTALAADMCRYQSDSFTACAEETLPKVIEALVAIASKRCRTEVSAHNRCLKRHGGRYSEECGATDARALACAAAKVIEGNESRSA